MSSIRRGLLRFGEYMEDEDISLTNRIEYYLAQEGFLIIPLQENEHYAVLTGKILAKFGNTGIIRKCVFMYDDFYEYGSLSIECDIDKIWEIEDRTGRRF